MQAPPQLTDRKVLELHRIRANAAEPALFIHDAVIDELQERLQEVNRPFTNIAIVTGWPTVWAGAFPDAKIVPDAEMLALDQGKHDLVIHALALHWANDPVGQLVQCRRALQPDGLFLGAMFGGQTLAELRTALARAEVAATGGLSPRIAPMAEIRDLGGLLQRAGFALPVADAWTMDVAYKSPTHLMHDLRAMGETNALSERIRRFSKRGIFAQLPSTYPPDRVTDTQTYLATFEIVMLTGWSPDESQQKPLRPGSAKARLADALGTTEYDPE